MVKMCPYWGNAEECDARYRCRDNGELDDSFQHCKQMNGDPIMLEDFVDESKFIDKKTTRNKWKCRACPAKCNVTTPLGIIPIPCVAGLDNPKWKPEWKQVREIR